MTQLLEEAMKKVAGLPPAEQDAVAVIVMEELASEQRWAELLRNSQELLARMAMEALADYDAGRTKPL